MPYHHEVVESPNRKDFDVKTYRRWHVMTTLVEYQGIRTPGRFIIPLRLVRPPETPGFDMEANSSLAGRSWDGALLQVPVWTWIKGRGPLDVKNLGAVVECGKVEVETLEPQVRSRPYPNLFLLARKWQDVGPAGAAHPVLGPMTVRVNPRLVETAKGRLFEGESV